MDFGLKPNAHFKGTRGPVVLAILDGVGKGLGDASDAVFLAKTPVLDELLAPERHCYLRAHGRAVGLPGDGDMGNSEVGHNALGCGRVHDQGALLVGQAIESGQMYSSDAWHRAMKRCAEGGTLHTISLLSDGNVHSHIDHLLAVLEKAAKEGVERISVHALLDGRDVPPTSALTYVDSLESALSGLRAAGVDARVASGGGRMTTTMDRYDADWKMVERGYKAHVHAEAVHRFPSLQKAVEGLREQYPDLGDQDLPAFVIEDESGTTRAMNDGDSVFLLNFRGDRALEISRALEEDDFSEFDRGPHPDLFFAGLMEYDGDLHIPAHYLVEPPHIEATMGEYLANNRISQLAISETQKYGHVTYFWNGNQSGKFDDKLETYIEIPSDTLPFEERPWMKAAEITDRLIAELRTGNYRFARVNYANGDMVGHTGHLQATITAMQVLDLQLARLRRAVRQLGGVLVVTADHGNADEMYQHDKKGEILLEGGSGQPMIKTSHTLNPVPFMIDDIHSSPRYRVEGGESAGIANVTATCLELLGFQAPLDCKPSLLKFSHE